ncbi:FAD-dependent oxidoreductase [Microbulbifer elongatus]|uniref:FAD-dependent oxidoreductase n=1 Tax=Microbulbifer elongatus TaxID=86173 RepID=UPI001CFCA26F|nr:FAD-dependent oxidoreductase [Microbulbifer elongatus]
MANYKVWECLVCGWTYNEAEGWPEDNIAPGTRWEDIPEDWLCPECGVSKADFEMVVVSNPESAEEAPVPAESASTPRTPTTPDPVIIVGSGLAGYNLAREIRKLDQQCPILLLTADDGRFYSKPLLSTGFHRKQTPDQMAIATAEEMARDLNITVHTFCEVSAVDRASRIVRTDTATFQYSKLVLATGAACVALPLQGDATERVYSINDLTDYTHFRAAMNGAKRVLVIGAGLIGCEYANDLVQSGYQVEVVDPMATALSSLLPPPASLSLQAALENAGVRFHFGTGVIRVDAASDAGGLTVTLRNGELLQADIVLSAVGVRPRTELARDAGLAVNRGIMVDRKLQTSDSEIYALGDCAEVDGHVLVYVAPLMASARALAKTLTGTPTQVYYGTMPVLIKTTLFPVVAHPPSPALKGGWIIEQNTPEGVRAIFKESSGMIAGFALTGTCVSSKEQLARLTQPLMPEAPY